MENSSQNSLSFNVSYDSSKELETKVEIHNLEALKLVSQNMIGIKSKIKFENNQDRLNERIKKLSKQEIIVFTSEQKYRAGNLDLVRFQLDLDSIAFNEKYLPVIYIGLKRVDSDIFYALQSVKDKEVLNLNQHYFASIISPNGFEVEPVFSYTPNLRYFKEVFVKYAKNTEKAAYQVEIDFKQMQMQIISAQDQGHQCNLDQSSIDKFADVYRMDLKEERGSEYSEEEIDGIYNKFSEFQKKELEIVMIVGNIDCSFMFTSL